MTSAELAEHVRLTVEKAQSRITGIGAEQYEDSSTVQKFEGRPVEDVLENIREEVIDIINWAVMLDIRLQKELHSLRHSRLDLELNVWREDGF